MASDPPAPLTAAAGTTTAGSPSGRPPAGGDNHYARLSQGSGRVPAEGSGRVPAAEFGFGDGSDATDAGASHGDADAGGEQFAGFGVEAPADDGGAGAYQSHAFAASTPPPPQGAVNVYEMATATGRGGQQVNAYELASANTRAGAPAATTSKQAPPPAASPYEFVATDGAVTMDAGGLAKPGTQAGAAGNAYELASADTRAGPPAATASKQAPPPAASPYEFVAADGRVTMDAGAGAGSPQQDDVYAYESPPAPSTAALPGAGSGWASLAGESTTTLPRPQKTAAQPQAASPYEFVAADGQVTMDGVAPASGAGNAASPYEFVAADGKVTMDGGGGGGGLAL